MDGRAFIAGPAVFVTFDLVEREVAGLEQAHRRDVVEVDGVCRACEREHDVCSGTDGQILVDIRDRCSQPRQVDDIVRGTVGCPHEISDVIRACARVEHEHVSASATGQYVVASATGQSVIAIATCELVGRRAADDVVGTRAADEVLEVAQRIGGGGRETAAEHASVDDTEIDGEARRVGRVVGSVGGLGDEGAVALREFVREGGTLVCLEDSSLYAIEALALPVKNVLAGLKTSEFYGPGSIVGASLVESAANEPLTAGMPREFSAYFDRSLAFEIQPTMTADAIRIVARYADRDALQSGWLLGPEKIQGKAAVVAVPLGKGHVVLFGFPPQHRGQTHGTFRLLLNALRLDESS